MTEHREGRRSGSGATSSFLSVSSVIGSTLVAAALVGVLGACSALGGIGGQQTPQPGATTSGATPASGADAIRQVSINEAKRRYVEFYDLFNEVAADKGRDGFVRMIEGGYLGTPEMRSRYQDTWDLFVQQGLTQSGAREVVSTTVTDFEGDPEAVPAQSLRIRMDACIDTSAIDLTREDGVSALPEGAPTRLVEDVIMQRQPDGHWSVNQQTNTGKEC